MNIEQNNKNIPEKTKIIFSEENSPPNRKFFFDNSPENLYYKDNFHKFVNYIAFLFLGFLLTYSIINFKSHKQEIDSLKAKYKILENKLNNFEINLNLKQNGSNNDNEGSDKSLKNEINIINITVNHQEKIITAISNNISKMVQNITNNQNNLEKVMNQDIKTFNNRILSIEKNLTQIEIKNVENNISNLIENITNNTININKIKSEDIKSLDSRLLLQEGNITKIKNEDIANINNNISKLSENITINEVNISKIKNEDIKSLDNHLQLHHENITEIKSLEIISQQSKILNKVSYMYDYISLSEATITYSSIWNIIAYLLPGIINPAPIPGYWNSASLAPAWINISLNHPTYIEQIELTSYLIPEGEVTYTTSIETSNGEYINTTKTEYLYHLKIMTPISVKNYIKSFKITTSSSSAWVAWGRILLKKRII